MEAAVWSLVLAKLLEYKRKLNACHCMTGRAAAEKMMYGLGGPSKNKSKNAFFSSRIYTR